MDNQHRKIEGYRELDEAEIDAMNHAKQFEARILQWMHEELEAPRWPPGTVNADKQAPPDARTVKADQRWLAIAKTQLQQGFMALGRSIARPDGF